MIEPMDWDRELGFSSSNASRLVIKLNNLQVLSLSSSGRAASFKHSPASETLVFHDLRFLSKDFFA